MKTMNEFDKLVLFIHFMDLLSFSQRVAMIYHVVLFGYYRPPMKLWECNVFSRVCLSVHTGRGCGVPM